ncbi:MAG: hypothetical protein ACK4K9_08800 [Bacteroidia bacterium]
MKTLKAVIDIGTNTFNLLIGEIKDKELIIYYNTETPVKLGKKGINEGIIREDALKRGLDTLTQYKAITEQFGVNSIITLATATIRNAKNANIFIEKAQQILNTTIKTISGLEEAELIYKGAINSYKIPDETLLVMDIGGGSVEIIIGKKQEIFFCKSYEAGALKLLELFNPNNPFTGKDFEKINTHLQSIFFDLIELKSDFEIDTMIGTAGSFDSLTDVLENHFNQKLVSLSKNAVLVQKEQFDEFYNLITKSSINERINIRGLVDFRVETIPVAALLMHFIVTIFNIEKIIASKYALKEGVFFVDPKH